MIYPSLQKPLRSGGLPPFFKLVDWGLVLWLIFSLEVQVAVFMALYFSVFRQLLQSHFEKEPFWLSLMVREWRYRSFYPGGALRGIAS